MERGLQVYSAKKLTAMQTLYFDSNDNLDTILTRILNSQERELKLEIPKESVVYQNYTNVKIIKQIATNTKKNVEINGLELKPKTKEETEIEGKKETPDVRPVKKLKSKKRFFRPKLLVIFFTFVVVLLTALFSFICFYLPRAQITLFVKEKSLEKENQVLVSPEITEVSVENFKIPGKVIKVEEEETESSAATGKATLGEKASGKITIQNWMDQKIVIQAGTQIKVEPAQEGAGLIFTLDSDILVPAQTFSIPTPGQKLYEAGQAEAAVTAQDIGEAHNLGKGLSFSITNYEFSNVSATNSSNFTGGSTREATVISQEDQNNARSQLSNKLFAKGKQDLETKLLGDQKLLENAIKNTILSTQSSHNIGEEVSDFEITIKTESRAIIYSESHLKNLLSKALETSIPEGFKLSSEQISLSAEVLEIKESDELVLLGKIKVLLIPDFQTEEIAKKLLGKRPQEAQDILKNTPELAGFEINLWPRLPEFLRVLPYRKERLHFKIEIK